MLKKTISVAVALIMGVSLFAVPVMAEEESVVNEGVLTMLNMSEDDMSNYITAQGIATVQLVKEGFEDIFMSAPADGTSEPMKVVPKVTYYDTLDAMLMALNAGDIDDMYVYKSTADYIYTPDLVYVWEHDDNKEENAFAEIMYEGLLSSDFSFMMLEDNEVLRDEFNTAIASMKEDGTLDALIEEHINKAVADKSATPAVELPVFEDADTIKIAVTGSLPPLDYVAPDGTPAGFSTAVLAEIGNRLGKNIEIVVVDSVGRAAALASGVADAVFWTRSNSAANRLADGSETGNPKAEMSEDELKALEKIKEHFQFSSSGTMDMPEGTIITEPYFSDNITALTTHAHADEIKAVEEQ